MPPHSFSEFDTPPSSSSSRHDTHEDDDSTDCSGGIAGIQLELLEMEQDDDDDNQLSSTPPLAAKKDKEEPSSSVEEDPHDPICMDLQDIDLWNADETEDMTVVPPIIPSRPLGGGGGMPHHHHLVETVVSSSSSSESESDSDDDDDDDDSDDDDDDDTESEPEDDDDDDEKNTTTTTSGGGGSTTLFRTTRPKKRKTNTSTLQPQHHVTFTDIHIREYTQVLGDHPCCSLGPPVSLGWEYRTCANVSLDYYEVTRVPRRSRRDLRLSWEDRRSILSNYSDGDCRRVQRRLNRENVSKATGSRSNGLFFRTTTTP